MRETPKFTTFKPDLVLCSELAPGEIRQLQRRIKQGELNRMYSGVATAQPASDLPVLVRRELIRLLASLYLGAVFGPRSAFAGGGSEPTRGQVRESVCQAAVEQKLIDICESRGEEELGTTRDTARALAPTLGLEREFVKLNNLISSTLGTRKATLTTAAGKELAAAMLFGT